MTAVNPTDIPGASQKTLLDRGLPPEALGLQYCQSRGIVVTLGGFGDVDHTACCPSEMLIERPCVTWSPAGQAHEKFTLLMLHIHPQKKFPTSILWLVVDVPGEPNSKTKGTLQAGYGLAGNCTAVMEGT
eukprot:2965102-Amphidinium_carterae.1